MMVKQKLNPRDLLELDKTEQLLVQAYRCGYAADIICALKACGSLPAHWPERPDRH